MSNAYRARTRRILIWLIVFNAGALFGIALLWMLVVVREAITLG